MLCRYPKLLTVTPHFGFEPTLLISYTRLENKYNTKYIIVIQISIFDSNGYKNSALIMVTFTLNVQ